MGTNCGFLCLLKKFVQKIEENLPGLIHIPNNHCFQTELHVDREITCINDLFIAIYLIFAACFSINV